MISEKLMFILTLLQNYLSLFSHTYKSSINSMIIWNIEYITIHAYSNLYW